ncbi:hypothetical protein M8494_29740 [Serratia ureilytica]
MSEGTHWLIQQGAHLVTGPKDIARIAGKRPSMAATERKYNYLCVAG